MAVTIGEVLTNGYRINIINIGICLMKIAHTNKQIKVLSFNSCT